MENDTGFAFFFNPIVNFSKSECKLDFDFFFFFGENIAVLYLGLQIVF